MLRQQLQLIADKKIDKMTRRQEYGKLGFIFENPIRDMTCFAYALGFIHSNKYKTFLNQLVIRGTQLSYPHLKKSHLFESQECFERAKEKFFINSDFIKFLMRESLLVEDNNVSPGDIIIYFENELLPAHAGQIIMNNKIKSQWGITGITEHKIYDVPTSYGNKIKYFKSLLLQEVETSFFKDYKKTFPLKLQRIMDFLITSGQEI